MILYGVKQGKYYNIENFKHDLSDMEEKGFSKKIYINVTNKCNCACTFCLRSTKEMNENNSLWLKKDNTAQMIIGKFKEYDWKNLEEIIFCGFGEPTMCMDTVLEVADYLDIMTIWYRDVLLYKATKDVGGLVFGDQLKFIKQKASKSSYEGLETILESIEKAKVRIKANVNFDLTMELLLLTIKEN